jgi:small subunit ribosomal protein S11e
LLAKKTAKGVRYYKDIGLGFKTPKNAISGHYVDKKCPFTGNVSIRGKLIKSCLLIIYNRGIVISNKMTRTLIIRRDYLHYIEKYNRYEKRHRNIPVHISDAFDHVKEGDIVVAG